MFGRSAFGSSNNSTSPFGNNSGFGSNQNKSAFGSPTTNTTSSFFGQQNKPQSLFGSSNSGSLFGSSNTGGGGFGTTNTSGSIFGSTNQSTTGGGIFGSSNTNTGSSIFGSNANKPSGGLFSSGFGSNTSTPAVVGTTIKFEPVITSDTMMRNGKNENTQVKLMCITIMKQYESKCLEELRVEDYLANRKGPQAGSTTGFFGSSTSNTGGGLFGSTTATNTSNNIFGSSTQQKPSLFGSTTQSSTSVFGSNNQSTGGGLFGNNQATTTNTSGGLFGSQPASTGLFGTPNTSVPSAFGSSTTTSGGLFGSKPASAGFGTTTNTGTSLFGSPATSTAGFGANTGTSTFGFGSTTTTQQPSTGFAFGSTNTAANATSSIFGSKPAGTTTGFGSTSTGTTPFGSTAPAANSGSIFGNTTASKPLFGSTTSTTGGGLFGQTQTQSTSLFGSTQSTQPATGFGAQQISSATAQAPVSTQVVHQPIIIGSDVNQTAIQHALIDAQIAASPYGCSPLLKLSYEKKENKGKDDIHITSPFSKQRQMKFLASKAVDPAGTISLAPVNKTLAAPSTPKLNNSSVGGLQYKSFYSPKNANDSLIYKDKSFSRVNPLANASAISGTGELNTSTASGNVSSIANHSLLNKSTNPKNSSMKQIDPVVMATLLKSTPGRVKIVDNNCETPNAKSTGGIVKRGPLSHSTPHDKNRILEKETEKDNCEDASSIIATSNISTECLEKSGSNTDSEAPGGIQVFSGHYYLRPSIEEMSKLVENGKVHLRKGLLISRQGYGSVYWPGPFDLSNVVIDDVVIFKRREVTVYPDDENKPPLGEGLNRPAEISLECVWPVDPDTKEYIQDIDRLEEINFRDRLERISLKNDSIFLDYKPSTGTWTFKVKHFSKYGFDDADENEAPTDSAVLHQQKKAFKKDPKTALTPLGKSVSDITMEDISSIQMVTDNSSLCYDVDNMGDIQFVTSEQSFINFRNPELNDIPPAEDECDILKKKMKMDDIFNMSASLIGASTSFIDKRLERSVNISLPISKKAVELKIREPVNEIPFFSSGSYFKDIENIFIDLNVFNARKCSSSLNNNFIFLRKDKFNVEPIYIVSEATLESQCKLSKKLLDVTRNFIEMESLMETDGELTNEISNTSKLLLEYIGILNDNKSVVHAEEISIYKFIYSFFSSSNKTENLMLEGLLNWVAEEATVLNGSDISESSGYKLIFEYICVGNIDKAYDEAIKINDFELASSIADHGMSDELQYQSEIILGIWDKSNNSADQDEYLLKIYMILGNVYEHKLSNNKTIRWDTGLHWKVALGIVLLFMSSHKNNIKEVVKEFLENTSCHIDKGDIIMSIIKLCCGLEDNGTSVAKALLTFSNYEDYRLCWHVMNVLVSLMGDKIDSTSMNTIHLYYAEQLFHSACYNDAFFVLEHLSNNDLKKIHVNNYKHRMPNHLSTI
uniref:Nuclear pore complex protein Nup98-Nup96 n=1 Tax=Strongyloides papillosus TaxID=174720 RepID=A0A0N5CBU3_STREA